MKYKNLTASDLVKTGSGKIGGFIVSSHSSGTLRFVDGLDGNDDIADKATGVLTVSGAIVPGQHAVATLTSNATAPANDATVTLDARVYTAKTTLTGAANEVLIGASASAFLDNLKSAVNATAGAGSTYGTGTVVHATIIAHTKGATTILFVARTIGTAANSFASEETDGTLSFGGATFASGVVTTAATVTVGTTVYTFVNELTETSGAASVSFQVLWGGSTAIALDNIKIAVVAGATVGTEYSTGTTAHPTVTSTTNTNTAQTFEALTAGTGGNAIATTETLTNGSFASVTLTGGLEANVMIMDTFTFPTGSSVQTLANAEIDFNVGLYATIGGTAEITVVYK